MAMYWFNNRVLVILLITITFILCDCGLLTKGGTTANANGNTIISGPFLQIEKPAITRLIITKPHLPHNLSCIATIEENHYSQNETRYFFTWFRNGNEIPFGRRSEFHIYKNGTLRLPPNEKASGVYRCKINANTTAVLSESITVKFPVLKRIPAIANITAYDGLPTTFNCPVLSVPQANITWFYGNVSLSNNFEENRYLILANGSLILRKLTLHDSGKYKCLAQNQYAAKNHRQFIWSLTVETQPALLLSTFQSNDQLIPHLQNTTQYIPVGDSLTLSCSTLNSFSPIEWWFQRLRTPNSPLVKLSNHSNEYYIRYASVEEHEGYYTCSTQIDNQSFHVIITVPPTIVEPLPSYESLIASSMTFRCRTTGNPRPIIQWYHNGAPFNSSYTRYMSGNELLIHSFDPDENGIYQCFARNIAGEVYSAAEVRFRSKSYDVVRKNPLQNIRCFAQSFNTINITFDKSNEPLFIVHIIQNNPHRWITPFAPMKLNHTSYVVISSHFPVYRPFQLITRVLFPTSEIRLGNEPQQQTILSSLRSPPVTCCTQGLLLHFVHLGNDTFVTWSLPDIDIKKYFILQFSINYTHPHPKQLLTEELRGTIQHVDLNQEDVSSKLTHIEALNDTAARRILNRAESKYIDNDARANNLETDEDIYNLVVPANITGVLIRNFTRIKLRVLIITTENEDLQQDFRYVQWKIIENDTTEVMNTPFRLTTVESRMLVFHFKENFNESCIRVCQLQIQFPIIKKEEPKCDKRTIVNSQLEIRGLKPTERYRLNFLSCENQIFHGQLDVLTLPDPPGTISNQRMTRQNGLKLNWDPPLQPNGKIHHYNILWTLGNVTHEANVMECNVCYYKFPNISENAKINVTVRVVGETGVGAPIFIDLRDINHHTLEVEHTTSNSEVYSGIAIGSLLSTFCIFCFALLIIFHRKRFKARQQVPTHLTSPSDTNFGNLSSTGVPGDSAGGLSGCTLQQDCHEMQTLIPKSGRNQVTLFAAEHANQYQTTQLPNGNGNGKMPRRLDYKDLVEQSSSSVQQDFNGSSGSGIITEHSLSQLPLCSSTPEKRSTKEHTEHRQRQQQHQQQDAKPFFIHFKQSPPNVIVAALQKHSSSTNFHDSNTSNSSRSSGSNIGAGNDGGIILPPTTLPLVASLPSGNASRRTGHASSGSVASGSSSTSSSSNSKTKQFHTNYPKHSNSNDGICLLAEEESAATLTPTSETSVPDEMALTNGFKANAANRVTSTTTSMTAPTSTQTNFNNNNSKMKKSHDATSSNRRPAAAATTTTATISLDPAIRPAAVVTMTSIAAAAAATKTTAPIAPTKNVHRRPNVDPNG